MACRGVSTFLDRNFLVIAIQSLFYIDFKGTPTLTLGTVAGLRIFVLLLEERSDDVMTFHTVVLDHVELGKNAGSTGSYYSGMLIIYTLHIIHFTRNILSTSADFRPKTFEKQCYNQKQSVTFIFFQTNIQRI